MFTMGWIVVLLGLVAMRWADGYIDFDAPVFWCTDIPRHQYYAGASLVGSIGIGLSASAFELRPGFDTGQPQDRRSAFRLAARVVTIWIWRQIPSVLASCAKLPTR
jgi:hypothetical protein